MNMANAAFSLGIDSCWVNRAKEMIDTDFGKQVLLNLGIDPNEYEGVGNLVVGYRKGFMPKAKKRVANFYYNVTKDFVLESVEDKQTTTSTETKQSNVKQQEQKEETKQVNNQKDESTNKEVNTTNKGDNKNISQKETTKQRVYHVSQEKDKKHPNFKEWRVRMAGSDKTIKFFKTQNEAI